MRHISALKMEHMTVYLKHWTVTKNICVVIEQLVWSQWQQQLLPLCFSKRATHSSLPEKTAKWRGVNPDKYDDDDEDSADDVVMNMITNDNNCRWWLMMIKMNIKSYGVVVTDTDSNDSVTNRKRSTFSRICFDFSFITKWKQ